MTSARFRLSQDDLAYRRTFRPCAVVACRCPAQLASVFFPHIFFARILCCIDSYMFGSCAGLSCLQLNFRQREDARAYTEIFAHSDQPDLSRESNFHAELPPPNDRDLHNVALDKGGQSVDLLAQHLWPFHRRICAQTLFCAHCKKDHNRCDLDGLCKANKLRSSAHFWQNARRHPLFSSYNCRIIHGYWMATL